MVRWTTRTSGFRFVLDGVDSSEGSDGVDVVIPRGHVDTFSVWLNNFRT